MTINNSNISTLNPTHGALYSTNVSLTQKTLRNIELYISRTIEKLEKDDCISTASALKITEKIRELVDLDSYQDSESHFFDFVCVLDSYLENLCLVIENKLRHLDESIMTYYLENVQYIIDIYKKA